MKVKVLKVSCSKNPPKKSNIYLYYGILTQRNVYDALFFFENNSKKIISRLKSYSKIVIIAKYYILINV